MFIQFYTFINLSRIVSPILLFGAQIYLEHQRRYFGHFVIFYHTSHLYDEFKCNLDTIWLLFFCHFSKLATPYPHIDKRFLMLSNHIH